MSTLKDSLRQALTDVTKDYVREKRRAYRDASRGHLDNIQLMRLQEREGLRREEERIKSAAFRVMAQAYELASDNGTLPANARQVMYAARPLVLKITGGTCWKSSNYFTQILLPTYQQEYPDECSGWDVVFDARGHFVEPHVRQSVNIGTLDVRAYVRSWADGNGSRELYNPKFDELYPTKGPKNRYRYALFIEKEGFTELLNRAGIAERYDMAIFSSKGQSTTATRLLVDKLSQAGVTIFVVHDFDRAGLLINHYLANDSRRYEFTARPNVIDLGLRLADVEKMALQSEPFVYKQRKDPGEKLREFDDVTPEEISFLIGNSEYRQWNGQRVELNAMTSRQFITWLEDKFKEQGVSKFVPQKPILDQAWQWAEVIARLNRAVDHMFREIKKEKKANKLTTKAPANLARQLAEMFAAKPELPWDRALVRLRKKKPKPDSGV